MNAEAGQVAHPSPDGWPIQARFWLEWELGRWLTQARVWLEWKRIGMVESTSE